MTTSIDTSDLHTVSLEKIETSRREHTGRLFLAEDEVVAYARTHPHDTEPLYVAFGHGDAANPRNWGVVRKYYIVTLASMLNVIT
jgi:hypothetical protein